MKKHSISSSYSFSRLVFSGLIAGVLSAAVAQDPEVTSVERMSTVTVEADYDRQVEGPFLPDVEGTRINAGKKTSSIDLRDLPEISNDNYRQVIATTPGLVLSEESTPLLSIGYRGFEPHRMQYFQVLEDGIPIHADMIGYPEAYYTPPLDAVERVEFIRGGAALMYGPQPAGAINFVMKKPPTDTPFEMETMNLVGSFNYFSNFTSFGGTTGRLGYYGWYDHRQTDGFREANSDFFLNAWSGTFALDATSDRRWYLNLTAYDEVHGEPGGLTLADGPNTVNYDKDRNATSRFFDRMRVSRYSIALIHEWDISDRTLFTFRAWWDYYLRYSRRQRGGGFGTLPTGAAAQTNSIETQQFYTFGIEPRIRHDWDWLDQTHTVTGGMMLYNTYSPRTDGRGDSPTAMQGRVLNQNNRYTWYYSIFAENKFQIGNLSITPGVRLESIWQSVIESKNVARTDAGLPLSDETLFNFVPLFGLGLEYKFTPQVAAYANVSQAYRPPIFTQAVPTGPNVVVDGNLQESFVWNYEVGFRGDPTAWVNWDTSLWAIDSSDQIGTRTADNGNLTIIENAGRAFTYGWDFSLNLDLVGLADAIFNQPASASAPATDGKSFKSEVDMVNTHRSWVDTYGSLSVFNALTLMKGEFIGGPNEGNTPQYTPDYVYRVGLIYNWRDLLKVAFLGNFNGSSYADDTNTESRFIPAYDVWDLTIEAKVYRDNVSIIGGINNIFDADYYARIRPDGIDPAMPRNWYAGLKVEF
jgi:Fe(3+) dicitrate transport protein